MRALGASLALAMTLAGCDLKPTEAKALLERELELPVKQFCCARIDNTNARASCEAESEARCGYAAKAHVIVGELEKHSHGEVVQLSFDIDGPKGRGRGWAQLIRENGWYVSGLRIDPPASSK